MSEVVAQADLQYLGVDIVESLVARNSQSFGSERVQFRCADVITDQLEAADLVFVRDLMIHLSLELGLQLLHNLADSQISYLMLTHDLAFERYTTGENMELDDGRRGPIENGVNYLYRPVCMTLAPFNLPTPILSIRESDVMWDGYKSMSLWSREQLVSAGYGKGA